MQIKNLSQGAVKTCDQLEGSFLRGSHIDSSYDCSICKQRSQNLGSFGAGFCLSDVSAINVVVGT